MKKAGLIWGWLATLVRLGRLPDGAIDARNELRVFHRVRRGTVSEVSRQIRIWKARAQGAKSTVCIAGQWRAFQTEFNRFRNSAELAAFDGRLIVNPEGLDRPVWAGLPSQSERRVL